MEKTYVICRTLKRILDVFIELKKVRYTGIVNFRIDFYNGGARNVEAEKGRKIKV